MLKFIFLVKLILPMIIDSYNDYPSQLDDPSDFFFGDFFCDFYKLVLKDKIH